VITTAIEFIPEGVGLNELVGFKSEASSGAFMGWLSKEMNAVNQQIQNSDIQVQQLATGETDNLHQIMLSLEKAKLGLELVVQVRNKLLEGYQDILRMQV
jgi:flagellar hook-basal body complex protein FliE